MWKMSFRRRFLSISRQRIHELRTPQIIIQSDAIGCSSCRGAGARREWLEGVARLMLSLQDQEHYIGSIEQGEDVEMKDHAPPSKRMIQING